MARKRMIDPRIWDDRDFGTLTDHERLLFIAMFSLADDEGIEEFDAVIWRGRVWRYRTDVTIKDVENYLSNIAKKMRSLKIYECEGKYYYGLARWGQYQKVQRPAPSVFPTKSRRCVTISEVFMDQSMNDHGTIMDQSWINHASKIDSKLVSQLDSKVVRTESAHAENCKGQPLNDELRKKIEEQEAALDAMFGEASNND
jgi:hypothetical protein